MSSKMDAKSRRTYEDALRIPLMTDLTPFLEETASPFLTNQECRIILRDLLIFADENPIGLADNLFKLDQVTDFNSHDPRSNSRLNRNWQWVLYISSGDSIQEIAWRKSTSVQLGRLMMIPPQGNLKEECKSPQIVIGFWLMKIYEAITPGIKSQFFQNPTSLKMAYFGFLKWKGMHWRHRTIALNTLNIHYTWLKRSKASKMESKKDIILNQFWNDKNEEEEITHFPQKEAQEFCKGIGTKRLELYLRRTFNGTLEEFRCSWEMDQKEPMVPDLEDTEMEEPEEESKAPVASLEKKNEEDMPRENTVMGTIKNEDDDIQVKFLTEKDLLVPRPARVKKRPFRYLS